MLLKKLFFSCLSFEKKKKKKKRMWKHLCTFLVTKKIYAKSIGLCWQKNSHTHTHTHTTIFPMINDNPKFVLFFWVVNKKCFFFFLLKFLLFLFCRKKLFSFVFNSPWNRPPLFFRLPSIHKYIFVNVFNKVLYWQRN